MSDVVICECFARDGLQHEPQMLPLETKLALIDQFTDMGLTRIEAMSYSNPKVIPQFADATEVLAGIRRGDGVYYKATCANVRAVERALADTEKGIGANEISLLVSATDSHSLKNLKRTREDQWKNITDMVAAANGRYRMVGTISMAFGCPFEGTVSESDVLKDVEKFSKAGVQLVALGDTTGMAVPATTQRLFSAVIKEFPDVVPVAHFHDSRGTGIVNYLAAYESGVRYFDCSMGGVGGHPTEVKYGGGFTGNVCTEDWVNLLESMGVTTGIDLEKMMATSAYCESVLGRQLYSKVALSGLNPLLDRPAATPVSAS
ncbi:isopropylmalate/homocitrate/citramalate synthase [Advenella kashmirensis W13003]|uniref:Isopropylmalate/homocitrate/citramalate synthase n=1 Tax=Advenella kashmirensis W13003 TaxID=1424334 RepID=V8QUU0_9BURK|nr:hydroxymethylglutaryl-CoA lyase [Advenella kashmirensis]ETF03417.1 isopropylmalate/homocitrate/citramalate synthase [Advenella kashmirensis W13003]